MNELNFHLRVHANPFSFVKTDFHVLTDEIFYLTHSFHPNILCDTLVQYGFVNYALELLVLKNFGTEIWETIK